MRACEQTGAGEADDELFDVVPNSQLTVTRIAFRNNTSKYLLDDKPSNFTEVTDTLKAKGIDLDNNRFLILQVLGGGAGGPCVCGARPSPAVRRTPVALGVVRQCPSFDGCMIACESRTRREGVYAPVASSVGRTVTVQLALSSPAISRLARRLSFEW